MAKVTATDEELIAQAVREGRVRRLSPKEFGAGAGAGGAQLEEFRAPVGEQRWLR